MKQKKGNIILLYAAFCGITFSCNTQVSKTEHVRKIEILPEKSEKIKLSQLFSSVDIVDLNSNNSVFSELGKLIVKNDLYYIKSANTIKVCNANGKLLFELSKQGKGQGEYLGLNDFGIEENGDIYINDREGRRVIHYNPDGKHLHTIKHGLLSYNFLKYKNEIYLNSGNLFNDKSEYSVNTLDEKQETIKKSFIKQDRNLDFLSIMEYTNFSQIKDTISYSRSFSNSIYQLKDDTLIPRFEIDFGKHNMPDDYITRFTDLRSFIEDFGKSDYASRIDSYREGEKYLFFTYSYQNKHPFVWFSKENNAVVHFDRFEDDLLFPTVEQKTGYKLLPKFLSDRYAYFALESYQFMELYEKYKASAPTDNPNMPMLDAIYNRLTESSNPLILKYMIK